MTHNGCKHCIPNVHGHKKNLLVNAKTFYWDTPQIKNMSEKVVDLVRIERKSPKSKQHVLLNNRVSTTYNPLKKQNYKETSYKQGVDINFCPVCGRNLAEKIPSDHPLLKQK